MFPKSSTLESNLLAASLKSEKPRTLARAVRGEAELRPIAGICAGGGVM